MSGHSKFANIKHKKEKNDAAKGKVFTIIGREIAVAKDTSREQCRLKYGRLLEDIMNYICARKHDIIHNILHGTVENYLGTIRNINKHPLA